MVVTSNEHENNFFVCKPFIGKENLRLLAFKIQKYLGLEKIIVIKYLLLLLLELTKKSTGNVLLTRLIHTPFLCKITRSATLVVSFWN